MPFGNMNKVNIPPKTCSALLNAGKCPEKRLTGSLSDLSCTRRSTACSDHSAKGRETSSSTLNRKSRAIVDVSRSIFSHAEKKVKGVCKCNCTDCVTLDNVPKHCLQKMEDQLQTMKTELCNLKNENQILRRHFLVAKRVVKAEIGASGNEDFDNLLRKANSKTWKGRQELIFSLKNKLHNLYKTLDHIDSEPRTPFSRKRRRTAKDDDLPEIFTDERTIYWCLELQKQDVQKSVERDRQKRISSRDKMKSRLNSLTLKNADLSDEIRNLKAKLSETPKRGDEKALERVQELKNKLKICLEEKAESRQKLDELQLQICRNSKSSAEIRIKTNLEKKVLLDTELKIKSLKAETENLQAVLGEMKIERGKQSSTLSKKLEDTEQDYCKIKLQQVLKSMADGKALIENSKVKESKENCILAPSEPRKEFITKQEKGDGIRTAVEILSDDHVHLYEMKLLKYRTLADALEHKIEHKLQLFFNVTHKNIEEIFMLLRNRYIHWKLTVDADALKARVKKFRKIVTHSTKQKLVIKKKHSSQQLIEILDEKKKYLAIRILECKFLKETIGHVYVSKEDDYELLQSFLRKNKDTFLKAVSNLKAPESRQIGLSHSNNLPALRNTVNSGR